MRKKNYKASSGQQKKATPEITYTEERFPVRTLYAASLPEQVCFIMCMPETFYLHLLCHHRLIFCAFFCFLFVPVCCVDK